MGHRITDVEIWKQEETRRCARYRVLLRRYASLLSRTLTCTRTRSRGVQARVDMMEASLRCKRVEVVAARAALQRAVMAMTREIV